VRLTGEGLLRDEAAAGVFHGKEGGDGRAPPGGPVQRGKGPSECRNRSRKRRRRCSREELRRESPEEGDLVAAEVGEEEEEAAVMEVAVARVLGKGGQLHLKARRRWRGAAPRHAVGRWHLPLLAPSTRVVAKS